MACNEWILYFCISGLKFFLVFEKSVFIDFVFFILLLYFLQIYVEFLYTNLPFYSSIGVLQLDFRIEIQGQNLRKWWWFSIRSFGVASSKISSIADAILLISESWQSVPREFEFELLDGAYHFVQVLLKIGLLFVCYIRQLVKVNVLWIRLLLLRLQQFLLFILKHFQLQS